jgi:hypothetical protein
MSYPVVREEDYWALRDELHRLRAQVPDIRALTDERDELAQALHWALVYIATHELKPPGTRRNGSSGGGGTESDRHRGSLSRILDNAALLEVLVLFAWAGATVRRHD